MCDKPTLVWVAETFDGKVYARGAGSMRRLGNNARQQWAWVTTDANAESVIHGMLPWLKNKRPEAEAALAFRATVSGGRLSPEMLEMQAAFERQLKALKRREYKRGS